jgi:hypothetical protein
MAEALALIGLASAIVQFVDFSTKVIGRIDRFRSKNNEVPVVFRDIKIQLPLLISGLKRTKERVERHEVALETQSAVLAVVQSCHAHVIVGLFNFVESSHPPRTASGIFKDTDRVSC